MLAGRDYLAKKVEWVTQTVGDGLGFDILSFDDADDSEGLDVGRELRIDGHEASRLLVGKGPTADLKLMDANLEYSASVFRRNWPDPADVDHLLDGLRKAGFE